MFERGDVSFSFTERIREIEENLRDQRFQSALALALTLPDICGGIAFPEMIKKYRDGRIMRNRSGEASRDTGRQYIQWIDSYTAPFLKKDPADVKSYINGEQCWQLRCEYLHQNRGFAKEDEQAEMHFHLGIMWICISVFLTAAVIMTVVWLRKEKAKEAGKAEENHKLAAEKILGHAQNLYLYVQIAEEKTESAKVRNALRVAVSENRKLLGKIAEGIADE